MKKLEALLSKCGFVEKNRVENNFDAVEDLIGFELPADHKYYLDNYEPFEGFVGEEYLVLYGMDDLLGSNTDEDLTNTVIIGSNGASETIGIRYVGPGNYKLVIAQYIQDIEDHIKIGDSFTDMLQRLTDGKEWFQ